MSAPTPTTADQPGSDPSSAPAPQKRPPRLPWQAVVAATVLALTAAGLVLLFLSGDEEPVAQGTTLQLTPAEDLDRSDAVDVEFTDPDGDPGTLRGLLDGRPMVVNFFASWCPPCIAEMPEFEAVSQELAGTVDFVGLAVQDRPEDASRIVDTTGVTYAWARDVRGDIAGAVGVVQMPTTMLIDADGSVLAVHAGALDADGLREFVEDNLS